MEVQKNRKYKPYNSLISMDGELNYCRLVLCKKPHEKRPIRRAIANCVKMLKMAIFRKTAKGEPREIFLKMADFLGKLWKAKKIGNTSGITA